MGAVDRNVEHHKLVRKNNERIKEHPPHQQHQEVQCAEVKLLFFRQVGTQSNRCHERYHMNEEDYVTDKRIRDRAAQDHLVERPQNQVG